MRHRRVCLLVVCCLFGLGACTSSGGDGTGPVDATASASPSPVSLTEDRLLGLWGADVDTAQERGLPWLRFDYDGTFGGFDGCNSVGGRWTLDQAAATVRADVRASTDVACPQRSDVLLDQLTFDGTALRYERENGQAGLMERSARPRVELFLIASGTNLLDSVPAPIYPAVRVGSPRERAVAGVEALLAAKESGKEYSSFWGKVCRLGTGVESITPPASGGSPVVVRLTGQAAAVCDLSMQAAELQRQQLAWTVVANLDVPTTTPVRVLGPGGNRLVDDIVPDPSLVSKG